MTDTRPVVAMLGLGRMGMAMARRFSHAGYDLVLWNRTPAKAVDLSAEIGAKVADSPSAASADAGVVVSSLADDAALRSVYVGEDGVASGVTPGTIVIDTSTVDPETVFEVGKSLEGRGATFLDCPVSGSVSTVEAGALVIMGGGDADALEASKPLLESMAKKVIHVGGRGAGAACKLAVNGLVHGLDVALSEALVLSEKSGVDRQRAYEVFASGAAGAPFVEYKRDAFLDPDNAAVAFTLDLMAKDLELITQLAHRVGAPMAQAETGLQLVQRAIRDGMGQRDLSAVAAYLREIS